MYKEWLTADEITEEINNLNITKKIKSKKRIQEVLKKIEKEEKNNKLFKIKKSPKHNGKGRKTLLYNKNFLQRTIEYYHKGFYFTNNDAAKNLVSKYLITKKNIEDIIPPNIKRRFRDAPQEEENFKRNIYNYQLKLGFFIYNEIDQYELKVQKLQQKIIFNNYKDETLKLILSITNLSSDEKIKIINKLESKNNIKEIFILQTKIKRIKFQKDKNLLIK